MKQAKQISENAKTLMPKGNSGVKRLPRPGRRLEVSVVDADTQEARVAFSVTGLWARLSPLVVLAALSSLVVVVLAFTPVGNILPGRLSPSQRSEVLDLAVRADSLEALLRQVQRFTANIERALSDSVFTDESMSVNEGEITPDSLLTASEAERLFVQQFEQSQRYNLSVLAPIAADGMIFESYNGPSGAVNAVYSGTVVALQPLADGTWMIAIQHPNNFVSVTSGLTDTYVLRGAQVGAGQRIGRAALAPPFELWHAGSLLDSKQYIPS